MNAPGTSAYLGSSPRLRGTRRGRRLEDVPARFIPAPAGNTRRRLLHGNEAAVHPRACGEHRRGHSLRGFYHGSSPRLRGTRQKHSGDTAKDRFIPAPAGNTPAPSSIGTSIPVHPRACGEHITLRCSSSRSAGSSPRLRGTRKLTRPRRPRWTVHPRACGEHRLRSASFLYSDGSSPRLRGTQRHPLQDRRRDRFIPAPAGNTLDTANGASTRTGSSPRLRGTQAAERGGPDSSRFIPAPAGNTIFLLNLAICPPVHPRACGEH